MVTSELLSYIQQQMEQGKSAEEIKALLTQQSWTQQDIDDAFQQLQNPDSSPIPTPKSDNHLIAVVLLLVFIYPIGLIFMWMWMKTWPKWVKWLLTLFFFLPIILGIGLAILLVAINPSQQLEKAQNVQRQSDTLAIRNAVDMYKRDHNGQLPPTIASTPTEISKKGADICSSVVPTYISALPVDPALKGEPVSDCSQSYHTGYSITVDANGEVMVTTLHIPATPNSSY